MKKLRYFCTLLLMAVVSVAWADKVTDVLNQTWTGVTGSSYTEKTSLEGSASDAIYTVQCAGGNSSIQLRSSDNSGIVTTTSGGTVTKVTVTWNSNTASGRTLNVYGSNSAYSSTSDLYDSPKAGTLIGTIVCGTNTELAISGNYAYIGLRSASGAMYLDEVKITWSTSGGSFYTVTYDSNQGSGTMTDPNSPYEENDEVTLLENTFTAPEGKLWNSWEVKDANDNVIAVTNGKFTMPASNVTVTAQWVADPNAPQINWVLTDLADLTANDVFVIVGNNGSDYAMTNNNGTGDAPVASAVTVANNEIISTVAANIQWNISGNATDGYTFYPNGSTSTWLYCTNTNNGVRVGTNANKTFKVDGGYLKHGGTSRYVGIYNSADWRCYTGTSNIANQTFAFYKKVVGGAIPPSISADDVNIADDATGGEIVYTIYNPVQGGSVNVSTTADWLTIGTDFESPIAFTCDANTGATARMATVMLTYIYDNSAVTTDVTVTQAAAPVIYTTIPELFAAATSTATNVTITFNNWVISAVRGNNAYLTDNQGNGLIIYQSGGHGFNVNDVLSGTASCNLVTYQGSAELTGLTAATEGLTVTTGGTVTEQSIAIADLTGVNTGALLHYDGLTYNGTDLVDGNNNSIKPYSTLYSYTFENGKTYNVTGIYLQYNNTKEILPRSAADIEEVIQPTVLVDPITVDVDAAVHDGIITVTCENMGNNLDFDVFFCNADGSSPVDYDWITADIDNENNVYYIIDNNTATESRTAYMVVKVADMDAKDIYNSNVITFTQAGKELPSVTWDLSIDETATATTTEMSWTSKYATMKVEKASASTNTNSYYPGTPNQTYKSTRFYKSSELTIAPKVGYKIIKVEFVANSANYASALNNSTWTNATASVDNTTVTVTPTNGNLAMVATVGGTCGLTGVKVYYEESDVMVVTIKEDFTATTFSCNKALDFTNVTGAEAFIITDENGTTQKVTKVPAGEGLYIVGAAGEYEVPVLADESEAEDVIGNWLVGTISEPVNTKTLVGDYTYYLFGKQNGKEAFFKVGENTSDAKATASEGKAYLAVPGAGNAKEMIVIGGDVTGINSIDNEQLTNDNYYTVDGKLVKGQPTQKGIYIVNGRKVVVK